MAFKNFTKINDELQEMILGMNENPNKQISHSLKYDCIYSPHYCKEAREVLEKFPTIFQKHKGVMEWKWNPKTEEHNIPRRKPTLFRLIGDVIGVPDRPLEDIQLIILKRRVRKKRWRQNIKGRKYRTEHNVMVEIKGKEYLELWEENELWEIEDGLRRINDFLAAHSFRYMRRPQLYRSFILEPDGSLTGGRIQMKGEFQRWSSEDRLKAEIDGNRDLAEADVKGIFPSIVYCMMGKPLGKRLADVEFYPGKKDPKRNLYKAAWMIILMSPGKHFHSWMQASDSTIKALFNEYGPRFMAKYKPQDLQDDILRQFPYLKNNPFSAAQLHRLESDWMFRVILKLVGLGIPFAGPIHDSIVSRRSDASMVGKVMVETFQECFGDFCRTELEVSREADFNTLAALMADDALEASASVRDLYKTQQSGDSGPPTSGLGSTKSCPTIQIHFADILLTGKGRKGEGNGNISEMKGNSGTRLRSRGMPKATTSEQEDSIILYLKAGMTVREVAELTKKSKTVIGRLKLKHLKKSEANDTPEISEAEYAEFFTDNELFELEAAATKSPVSYAAASSPSEMRTATP